MSVGISKIKGREVNSEMVLSEEYKVSVRIDYVERFKIIEIT